MDKHKVSFSLMVMSLRVEMHLKMAIFHNGVVGVGGSNPLAPTNKQEKRPLGRFFCEWTRARRPGQGVFPGPLMIDIK